MRRGIQSEISKLKQFFYPPDSALSSRKNLKKPSSGEADFGGLSQDFFEKSKGKHHGGTTNLEGNGVIDGTRTRNSQDHNLELYH